ncbi:MAG: hypothetical protein ACRC5C_13120 [Bacilli bacterium]
MSERVNREQVLSLDVLGVKELRERALNELQMPATWNVSNEAKGMISQSVEIYNTKHGLYAAIPMVCKGQECPYASVCPLISGGQDPSGSRCPLEIGLILKRYEEYVHEFGVSEGDVVDMSMIKDLIDYDVQLFRAENKIAMEGDFVEDVIISVTEQGKEITAPQISKAAEYKERIMAKKHKVLQLMHSTRSDKAGDKLTITLDPSSYAAKLMSQVAGDLKPGEIYFEEEPTFEEGEYEEVN